MHFIEKDEKDGDLAFPVLDFGKPLLYISGVVGIQW